jgi:ABC-2 type transport system permease protein
LLAPIGVLFGYGAIAREHESGALRLALSMPHDRSTLVVGRFVGRASMLGAAIVVGMGIACVLVVYPFGTLQPLRFLAFVLLSVGYGAIWVGIGVAASALVATNRRALVLAVAALFVLVIVWDAVTAGAEAGLIAAGITDGPIQTVIQVSAQLDPGSAFETLVTALATSDQGAGAWYDGPTLALPVFVGWLLGPLSVAILRFEWRDLA